MFVACGIWCLADVSRICPSSEQTDIFEQNSHAEPVYTLAACERLTLMALEVLVVCVS